MGNQQPYERYRQTIGRYTIFLRGNDSDVIMRTDEFERNMTAQEALGLLTWLYTHKRDLHEVVRRNEQASKEE